MSQIQFVNPSRLGPTPGESRVPSAAGPAGGASSFDDHLERAGRPAEQTPRGESKSALATPKDETPAQRDAEVDDGRSDESSPTGAPQSEAGTAEESIGNDGPVEKPRSDTDAAEDDAAADVDTLQLSGDAELIDLEDSTDDATQAVVAVAASTETATIDEAPVVIGAAHRRGQSDESSAVSKTQRATSELDVDVDVPDDKSGENEKTRRPAAVDRRVGRITMSASPEQIEEGRSSTSPIAKGTLPESVTTQDERGGAKSPVEPAISAAAAGVAAASAVASGDGVEGDAPAAAASATDHRQDVVEIASSPAAERPSGLADSDGPTSVGQAKPSPGKPLSRHDNSPALSTSPAEVAEAKPTQDVGPAIDTGSIDLVGEIGTDGGADGDRRGETTSTPAKLVLEPTAEIDRTASQRNTISVGSRLATARPGEGERGSVDRARFVGRVAGAFAAAGREGGEVRLRLHPPELGVVRLEVKLEAGVLTARFETETPSARTALLENMAALRERLAEQGIKIEKFNVDLMDRRSEETPYGSPGSHDRQQDDTSPNAADTPNSLGGQDGPSEESQSSTPAPAGNTGQLNVVI